MFKRNQVEDAIIKVEGPAADEPDEIRIRLKRLRDTDRKMPLGHPERAHFAFYSGEPPGTGQENWFTEYDAFALWVGYRLLTSGFPQGRATWLMRLYRARLEALHPTMLATDLRPILRRSDFLRPNATQEQRDRLVAEGRAIERIKDMIFLALHAEPASFDITTFTRPNGEPKNICRGPKELMEFIQLQSFAKRPVLVVELMNPAHQLSYWLNRSEPVKRGRKS